MSDLTLPIHPRKQEHAMSQERRIRRLEWAFRLLLVAFVALWVIYPPQTAAPTGKVGIVAGSRP